MGNLAPTAPWATKTDVFPSVGRMLLQDFFHARYVTCWGSIKHSDLTGAEAITKYGKFPALYTNTILFAALDIYKGMPILSPRP